jgi:hypothetical protein
MSLIVSSDNLVPFGGALKTTFLNQVGKYFENLHSIKYLSLTFNSLFPKEPTTLINSLAKLSLSKLQLHIRQYLPSFESLKNLDGKLKSLTLTFDSAQGKIKIGTIKSLEDFSLSVYSGKLHGEEDLVDLINGATGLKNLTIEKLFYESFNLALLLRNLSGLQSLKKFHLSTILAKKYENEVEALKKFLLQQTVVEEFSFKQSIGTSFFEPDLIPKICNLLEPCLLSLKSFRLEINRCKDIREYKIRKSLAKCLQRMENLEVLELVMRHNYFNSTEITSLIEAIKKLKKLKTVKIKGQIVNIKEKLVSLVKEFICEEKFINEIDIDFGANLLRDEIVNRKILRMF